MKICFDRQLPMMEGLLQGRVAYTFEEFKKRKFDKLFHYIIDLLNTLVPFLFHPKYIDHVELIIAHYFDVFMVNFSLKFQIRIAFSNIIFKNQELLQRKSRFYKQFISEVYGIC